MELFIRFFNSKSVCLVALIVCTLLSVAKVSAQVTENTTSFNIELRYETPVSPEVEAVFESARARWESVIVSDWGTTVSIQQGQEICGQPAPSSELVDDILIYVYVGSIDGTGNVLARAGPCAVDSVGRIRVGVMQFDLADLQQLIDTNRAQVTVLHEMGHVLGFGTLWEQKGLVGEPEDDDHELDDYELRYLGEQGNIGNEEVGMSYEAVVEDSGGEGTAGSHWEEDIYEDELMTGYVPDDGIAPMSVLTIRALADLGYDVDPTKAESYQVDEDIVDDLDWDDVKASSKSRLRGSVKEKLRAKRKNTKQGYGNDVIRMPLVTLVSTSKRR